MSHTTVLKVNRMSHFCIKCNVAYYYTKFNRMLFTILLNFTEYFIVLCTTRMSAYYSIEQKVSLVFTKFNIMLHITVLNRIPHTTILNSTECLSL